jgi:sulfite exporter TauE/SafE
VSVELWTALVLGLAGSLHCAGMCGPLALALPTSGTRGVFVAGRLLYNSGRVLTYALMGALLGLLGGALHLAGLQQVLALGLGAIMVVMAVLIWAGQRGVAPPTFWIRWVGRLRTQLGAQLKSRGMLALFVAGLLNGLLPCGFVYVGLAGAMAAGGPLQGMAYMACFGLGTWPMMLGISLAGPWLATRLRGRGRWVLPVGMAVVGMLLIWRGVKADMAHASGYGDTAMEMEMECH